MVLTFLPASGDPEVVEAAGPLALVENMVEGRLEVGVKALAPEAVGDLNVIGTHRCDRIIPRGLDRMGDNASIFSVIDLSDDTLLYRAFDAVGELYDGFTLSKDSSGSKTVLSDPVASSPEKTYQNTGPYKKWDDLRL